MYGAVAIHVVTDQAFHLRHVILGFVAGGCRLISHNHHDSEQDTDSYLRTFQGHSWRMGRCDGGYCYEGRSNAVDKQVEDGIHRAAPCCG